MVKVVQETWMHRRATANRNIMPWWQSNVFQTIHTCRCVIVSCWLLLGLTFIAFSNWQCWIYSVFKCNIKIAYRYTNSFSDYMHTCLNVEVGLTYQLPGIPTQSHIWVQFLQNEGVPFLQFIPQGAALDKVYMCHVRNVPHSPRNNKTWGNKVIILQQHSKFTFLKCCFLF